MGMVLTGEIHITNTGNIMCNRGQINARSVPDYAKEAGATAAPPAHPARPR